MVQGVVLRQSAERWQILAFRHPKAGTQLIKGTLETGERPEAGVLRELAEESGIAHAAVVEKLASWRLMRLNNTGISFGAEHLMNYKKNGTFSPVMAAATSFTSFGTDWQKHPMKAGMSIFKSPWRLSAIGTKGGNHDPYSIRLDHHPCR